MSDHLDRLDITRRAIRAPRSRRVAPKVEHRRNKLIANLEEQIELAKLALAGKPLVLKRKRGSMVVSVKPRIWWVAEDDGHVATQVLFNKKALNLAGRGSTIEVGKPVRLPEVFDQVIRATEAGELDNAIAAVVGEEAVPKPRRSPPARDPILEPRQAKRPHKIS